MKKTAEIDKNAFFREATIRICSSLNPDTALYQLLDYIKDIIPATGLTFGLVDFNSSVMEITTEVSLDKTNRLCPLKINIPKENLSELYQFWHKDKEKYLILNDPDLQKSWEREIRNQAWPPESSIMIIKLNLLNQNIGAFAVYTSGKNQYKEEHLCLIKMLHDPLAIAMSNALNYQEVIISRETLADDNRYLRHQLLQISGEAICNFSE